MSYHYECDICKQELSSDTMISFERYCKPREMRGCCTTIIKNKEPVLQDINEICGDCFTKIDTFVSNLMVERKE